MYLEDSLTQKGYSSAKQLGKKGELCASLVPLQADGTTSCGNCDIFPELYAKEGKIINMPWPAAARMTRRASRL